MAWLQWSPEKLRFAFWCRDERIVAAPGSGDERAVDGQDRVEIFLWSGRDEDPYLAIEIGARGALHDYAARFHRRFDSAWSTPGLRYEAASPAPDEYAVSGEIPAGALRPFHVELSPGSRIRAGLFRADFSSSEPGAVPVWIAWVDAGLPEPDFHVRESFGELILAGAE